MKFTEFKPSMQRLSDQWKNTYSDARIKLVWEEVESLRAETWANIVDRFLGESERAPLLPQIREAVALEREREWRKAKARALPSPEEFNWASRETVEANMRKIRAALGRASQSMDQLEESLEPKRRIDNKRIAAGERDSE